MNSHMSALATDHLGATSVPFFPTCAPGERAARQRSRRLMPRFLADINKNTQLNPHTSDRRLKKRRPHSPWIICKYAARMTKQGLYVNLAAPASDGDFSRDTLEGLILVVVVAASSICCPDTTRYKLIPPGKASFTPVSYGGCNSGGVCRRPTP